MIVKKDKTFETNSLFPDTDWYNEGNYVVDETKPENAEVIAKIKEHAPYIDLIIENGKLVDVIPRPDIKPAPEESSQIPTLDERLEAVEEALLILLMEV